VENPEIISFRQGDIGRAATAKEWNMGRGLSHPQTTRGFERILKIGQYLTKLCVDYSGLLFWPTLYIYTDVIYRTPLSCMLELLISAIICNSSEHSEREKFWENERARTHNANIGTKSGGGGICIDVSFWPKCKGCANHHHYTATLKNFHLWTPHFSVWTPHFGWTPRLN